MADDRRLTDARLAGLAEWIAGEPRFGGAMVHVSPDDFDALISEVRAARASRASRDAPADRVFSALHEVQSAWKARQTATISPDEFERRTGNALLALAAPSAPLASRDAQATEPRLAALEGLRIEAAALAKRLHGQDVVQRLAIALDIVDMTRPAAPVPSPDAQATDRFEEGWRAGLRQAAEVLIGAWADGDQGPPRSEIEQYAEVVLLRSWASSPPFAAPVPASAPPRVLCPQCEHPQHPGHPHCCPVLINEGSVQEGICGCSHPLASAPPTHDGGNERGEN
jgi:mRNA-degrading endonuclease toxin of MazEF toxin-antitoxin module